MERWSAGAARPPRPEDAPGEYRGVRFGREQGRRRVCCGECAAARFGGQVDGVRRLSATLLQREARKLFRGVPIRELWK